MTDEVTIEDITQEYLLDKMDPISRLHFTEENIFYLLDTEILNFTQGRCYENAFVLKRARDLLQTIFDIAEDDVTD